MRELTQIISSKPYLAWYVKDEKKLSEESVFEHILSYGDWEDYLKAEEILGIKEASNIFEKLKTKKRVNLRPQTVNYFNNYFQKYA